MVPRVPSRQKGGLGSITSSWHLPALALSKQQQLDPADLEASARQVRQSQQGMDLAARSMAQVWLITASASPPLSERPSAPWL